MSGPRSFLFIQRNLFSVCGYVIMWHVNIFFEFLCSGIDRGISGQLPNRSILMLLYVVINQKLNL